MWTLDLPTAAVLLFASAIAHAQNAIGSYVTLTVKDTTTSETSAAAHTTAATAASSFLGISSVTSLSPAPTPVSTRQKLAAIPDGRYTTTYRETDSDCILRGFRIDESQATTLELPAETRLVVPRLAVVDGETNERSVSLTEIAGLCKDACLVQNLCAYWQADASKAECRLYQIAHLGLQLVKADEFAAAGSKECSKTNLKSGLNQDFHVTGLLPLLQAEAIGSDACLSLTIEQNQRHFEYDPYALKCTVFGDLRKDSVASLKRQVEKVLWGTNTNVSVNGRRKVATYFRRAHSVTSPRECMRQCGFTRKCARWSWRRSTGDCLMSDVGASLRDDDWVTGHLAQNLAELGCVSEGMDFNFNETNPIATFEDVLDVGECRRDCLFEKKCQFAVYDPRARTCSLEKAMVADRATQSNPTSGKLLVDLCETGRRPPEEGDHCQQLGWKRPHHLQTDRLILPDVFACRAACAQQQCAGWSYDLFDRICFLYALETRWEASPYSILNGAHCHSVDKPLVRHRAAYLVAAVD